MKVKSLEVGTVRSHISILYYCRPSVLLPGYYRGYSFIIRDSEIVNLHGTADDSFHAIKYEIVTDGSMAIIYFFLFISRVILSSEI